MRQLLFDWLHQLTFHGSPVCVEVLKYQKRLITFFTDTTTKRCRRGRRLCGGVQPVWPDLEKTEHTWSIYDILFNIWPNFRLTLVNYCYGWANFNVVNGQILKKITSHLVTRFELKHLLQSENTFHIKSSPSTNFNWKNQFLTNCHLLISSVLINLYS